MVLIQQPECASLLFGASIMMRLSILVLLCGSASLACAEAPELLALQKSIHRIRDLADPSVACILVSRSAKYAELDEGPSTATPGKLNGFSVERHLRFKDEQYKA